MMLIFLATTLLTATLASACNSEKPFLNPQQAANILYDAFTPDKPINVHDQQDFELVLEGKKPTMPCTPHGTFITCDGTAVDFRLKHYLT